MTPPAASRRYLECPPAGPGPAERAAMALRLRRLTNPARTDVRDPGNRWLATFTDGATTATTSGPRRTFDEPSAGHAVTHAVWIRTLPKAFTGAVDEAWLTAALQANRQRVPDVLAMAMQYTRRSAAVLDGPLQIAGDAGYGPLVDGKREEGADFNDYLGVPWTYPDRVDAPERRQFRCLDCSGFVRMVWGYRHSLPGQPRRDRVPLTLAPTAARKAMPRRAFEIYASAPGIVVIPDAGVQVADPSPLAVGDLGVLRCRRRRRHTTRSHRHVPRRRWLAATIASSRAARARTDPRWATIGASRSSTGPASTRGPSGRHDACSARRYRSTTATAYGSWPTPVTVATTRRARRSIT